MKIPLIWKIAAALLHVGATVFLTEECTIGENNEDLSYEILETQDIRVSIGKIQTSDVKKLLLKCKENEGLIDYELNEDTGTLSFFLTKSVEHYPDRDIQKTKVSCELICNDKESNPIYLDLTIEDVNNNAPEFIGSPYEFRVSELAPVGTTVNPTPIVVVDKDYALGNNMKMTVTADMEGRNVFEISYTNKVYSHEQNVSIILKDKLDYEKETGYNFILTATDKGTPPLSSSATVAIRVIDEDDQSPKFKLFLYYAEIVFAHSKNGIIVKTMNDTEGIPIERLNKDDERLLLKIQPEKIFAYDQDTGINSPVKYTIGKSSLTDYFEMDKQEGHVSLKKANEETKNHSLVLPLEAYQVDNEKRRGRAALIVNVTVINPPQPHFVHDIYILKNLLAGDPIYQVKVLQDDVSYQLRENQKNVCINETTGLFSLLKNASQIPESFTSTIQATTSVLSVSNEFQGYFKVIDRDSRKIPLFDKSIYLVAIPKKSKKNDHLFKIQVTDHNAQLELLGNDMKYFAIKENTKWIILKYELEPEKLNYSVIIEAKSKAGNIAMEKDSAEILFLVTDADCYPRIFNKDIYLINISSEWIIGSNIFNNTLPLPGVTYSISGQYADYFYIENTTGSISLIKKINVCQKYEILLFGQKNVPPYYNSSSEIILQPTDQRCHSKLFEKDCYVTYISSDWKENDNILNLTVFLPVETFNLLGGDAAHFNISSSGKLYLTDKLDICRNYEFFISGEANEPIWHHETTQVILISKDPKCYAEIFDKSSFLIDISSEWKIDDNIINLTSSFPNVRFKLEGRDDHFDINATTGQLFLSRQLDECKKYQLLVHGKMEGPPYRNGTTKLIFVPNVCIKETREFSKCVYTVTIDDKNIAKKLKIVDFRKNKKSSNVKFEISEGKSGLFEIENGKLYITKTPDEGQYWIKVKQRTDEILARSINRNDDKEVSNTEALVIVNVGSQIKFLHPDNWFKLFLPTAVLSDYRFMVKAVSNEMSYLKFSISPKDGNDFEVDSSSGLVSPKLDVTMLDGYNTSFVIFATGSNNERAELNIFIFQLRYDNGLRIKLKNASPSNIMNLTNIERHLSERLKCDIHILQWKKTIYSEGYELTVGAVEDKQLLTANELEKRIKSETKEMQDIFGDFDLAPYKESLLIKKENDGDAKVDPLLISTILLACLSAILCILILIFEIVPKLRAKKVPLPSEELLEYEKSNNTSYDTAESKEPHSEKEIPPLPESSQLEVDIGSNQTSLSAIVQLDESKTHKEEENQCESSTTNILSNEPNLQIMNPNNENLVENKISKCKNEETDMNSFLEENVEPEMNNTSKETTEDNSIFLKNKADNQTYDNEAFEDTSFNLIDRNKINGTGCNNNPTNQPDELVENTTNDSASSESNKKKVSVKFDDIATLIP